MQNIFKNFKNFVLYTIHLNIIKKQPCYHISKKREKTVSNNKKKYVIEY